MVPGEYTFLFALGMIFAFMDSYGIGANDVSNSFASAVGSGALNLKQAVMIASVCEFLGAFLMGSATADTIKGGLINVELFASQPELLLLAMVCSLVGSSTWVLFASSRGWPVSTTHAIVGAITGAGIAGFGGGAVKWSGLGSIVLSWLISPIAAGLVTTAIFLATKFFILRHEDSMRRGLIAVPFYFGITVLINVIFVMVKGGKSSSNGMHIGVSLGIAFGVAAAVFLWAAVCMRTYLKRKLIGNEDLHWYHCLVTPLIKHRPPKETREHEMAAARQTRGGDSGSSQLSPDGLKVKNLEEALSEQRRPSVGTVESGLVALDDTPKPNVAKKMLNKVKAKMMVGLNHDINQNTAAMDAIHGTSTKFDSKTEQLFCTMQVLSSCFASFAHGSNDVANAIGPLATIFFVWKNGFVDASGKAPVPAWILAYGGIAIDIGILTYGYRVMATLGNNITYMSPSRGFSVSLGTSLSVLTCSKLGMPVSTTHCITGSTAAVGLASGGGLKSVNWKVLGMIASSWIFTLPAAGLVSGVLFALIINSPHKA